MEKTYPRVSLKMLQMEMNWLGKESTALWRLATPLLVDPPGRFSHGNDRQI